MGGARAVSDPRTSTQSASFGAKVRLWAIFLEREERERLLFFPSSFLHHTLNSSMVHHTLRDATHRLLLTQSHYHKKQGRQQRTKQGDPTPLAGSSAHPHAPTHTGKRKAGIEARSARDGPTSSRGGAKGGKGERKASGFLAGRGGTNQPSNGTGERSAKRAKKSKKVEKEIGSDDDDLEGLEEEDDFSDDDDEAFAKSEAKGLEAARS